MTTLLFTHEDCLQHDPGRGHPESPGRLRTVLNRLAQPDFAGLQSRVAPFATLDQIGRVHRLDHAEALLDAMPREGLVGFDNDTIASIGTRNAVLRAAGAVCAAVDSVATGEAMNAFCAVRPPGHHAESDTAMGFCFFNNIAVGAMQARVMHGFRRIAILDFDVHHGNGSQQFAAADPDCFFASTHQSPLYPGTGAASEIGLGNIVNRPLAAGASGLEFRAAWADHILPRLHRYEPDFIMISAGFDAHEEDMLAGLRLTEKDFEWVTAMIADSAARLCGGRLVSALEGGYHLGALAESVAAHVGALMAA